MSKQYPIQSEPIPFNDGKQATLPPSLVRDNARRVQTGIKQNHIASVLAWFGASYTTYLCVVALQPSLEWYTAVLIGLVVQFVFTVAERPFLLRKAGTFTYLILALDAIINAGGVYPALSNIASTPSVKMIASVGVDSTITTAARVLIALVIGVIIALAPEALWRMED